eukprot:110020-Pleurochrysis_carterae.AAC.3
MTTAAGIVALGATMGAVIWAKGFTALRIVALLLCHSRTQTARILNQLCEGCAIVASSAEAGIDKVVGAGPLAAASGLLIPPAAASLEGSGCSAWAWRACVGEREVYGQAREFVGEV